MTTTPYAQPPGWAPTPDWDATVALLGGIPDLLGRPIDTNPPVEPVQRQLTRPALTGPAPAARPAGATATRRRGYPSALAADATDTFTLPTAPTPR